MLAYDSRRLVATGNARLIYKDLTITADRIEVDLKENTLIARGNVVLLEGDRRLSSEQLAYDLDRDEGKLGPFQGWVEDAEAEGTIYFAGQELTRLDEVVIGHDLSLTTCSLSEPHYHFTAAEIEYHPHDRLILRQVYYWEGHHRLLYLPYLAISLRERENSFQFPRFGYSAEEGLFLKLAYNFFIGDDQSGVALLDLMQRKGIGEGLKYTWEFPAGAELSGLLYHLDNELTGGDDYRAQAALTLPLAVVKIQSNVAYFDESEADGGRRQTRQIGAEITPRQGSGPQLSLNYRTLNTPDWRNWILDLGARGNWQPWVNAQLNLAGRWYWGDDSLGGATRKENYEARLMQDWPWGKFTAILNSQVSPGYAQSLLPELRLDLPKLNAGRSLGRFSLTLDYQRKSQESPILTAAGERLAGDLAGERRRLFSTGPIQIEAWAWARGRLYDSGESLWAIAPELTLVTAAGPAVRLEAGLAWVFVNGAPPPLFAGDALTARGNLGLRGFYTHGRWQGRISTNYALATGLWQPVAASLSWSSPDGDRLNFATSYNPNLGTFGLTMLALGWRPKKDWSFLLNTSYDPATESWRQLDFMSGLKQAVGKDLTVTLKTRYDFFQEAWTQSQVTLDYERHCRTFSLGYDWTRAEITLAIWINAFPDHPLKLAYSESGFFFTPPFILP